MLRQADLLSGASTAARAQLAVDSWQAASPRTYRVVVTMRFHASMHA